jgi:hypothetical protein
MFKFLTKTGIDTTVDSRKDEMDRDARFQEVLDVEHGVINERREVHRRGKIKSLAGAPQADAPQVGENQAGDTSNNGMAAHPVYDTTGVALSGGGIRSAAFCLGALQSLATNGLIDKIDYLSTVSGGGYTGSAVSACMSEPKNANQPFPFAAPGQYEDPPAVGHVRDYSNYLLPRGHQSFVEAIAVVLRGLATNVVFVGAAIMLCAWVTVATFPRSDSFAYGSFVPQFLKACLFWFRGADKDIHPITLIAGSGFFAFTMRLALVLLGALVFWALYRSRGGDRGCDVRGPGVMNTRLLILAVVIVGALDIQPAVLNWLFTAGHAAKDGSSAGLFAAIAAPFAAAVAFFSDKLGNVLKKASQNPSVSALIKRYSAQALILVAAAVLPSILWIALVAVTAEGIVDVGEHTHSVLGAFAKHWNAGHENFSIVWLYCGIAVALFVMTSFFKPNANSLHQLYRDKLSKAFLFNPFRRETQGSDAEDLVPRDMKRLQDISPATGGPYHLLNAALNLQGSVYANRRGRNASFFLFSSQFVGSDVTGYVEAWKIAQKDPHLDLGTAMAISGAAVSSNMGSASIKPLAPTLALLNIRLGYWMINPRYVRAAGSFWRGIAKQSASLVGLAARPGAESLGKAADSNPLSLREIGKTVRRKASETFKFYLLAEIFGRINESSPHIYLTDGGHIENLGLYTLLTRRCRVIFVVDGEADPQLSFHALAIAQRYARIDLGVRIDLPWQGIADVANAATKLAQKGEPIPPTGGPHCAVGSILYPGGEKGVIVYVKASLTGDEPDYVVDYKMRNPIFPHESTGDQFFTEEQFEVYRALGFHALDGFLTGGRQFTRNKTVEAQAATAGKTVPQYVQDQLVNQPAA